MCAGDCTNGEWGLAGAILLVNAGLHAPVRTSWHCVRYFPILSLRHDSEAARRPRCWLTLDPRFLTPTRFSSFLFCKPWLQIGCPGQVSDTVQQHHERKVDNKPPASSLRARPPHSAGLHKPDGALPQLNQGEPAPPRNTLSTQMAHAILYNTNP